MIYTVTFNPAVDYLVYVPKLEAGRILRSKKESYYCGGKGINVSQVLCELECRTTAMGFVAGFTGDLIEKELKDRGILTDFVHLRDGFSRINVKIRSECETDINGQGPRICEDDIKKLIEKLSTLRTGDTLVLAGSIPDTLPPDMYEKIMAGLDGRGVRFVVDATKSLLVNSLKYRPFLVKPNRDELGEIFSVKINTAEDALKYAGQLQNMGAVNVLVSMGAYGAVLLDENGEGHHMPALGGKAVNTVGAGDSMVAGFIAGLEKSADYEYALKLGCAAGGATACHEGLATKNEIFELIN